MEPVRYDMSVIVCRGSCTLSCTAPAWYFLVLFTRSCNNTPCQHDTPGHDQPRPGYCFSATSKRGNWEITGLEKL